MADLRPFLAGLTVVFVTGLTACSDDDGGFSDGELDRLMSLGGVPDAQEDPSNAYAGNAMAESLGQTLYWDQGLSQDGSLGCVSCHTPALGWSVEFARSVGSSGPGGPDGTTEASLSAWHSPGVGNLGLTDYIFWDGRGDSLWLQARGALTSPGVHRLNELQLAKLVHERYGAEYDALFGAPTFDLSALDFDADPTTLTDAQQTELTQISVNVGKAIAAYELRIVYKGSEFDAFLAGDGELSDEAKRGAKLFVDDERGCISCHSGPALSDGWFHNVGADQPEDQGMDNGALDGLPKLIASDFNKAGPWSDDPAAGQAAIDRAQQALDSDPESLRGAFKTPGLRDVTRRPLYGHTGLYDDLGTWIDEYYGKADTGSNYPGINEITPRNYSEEEIADLVAFLGTLEAASLGDLEQP